MIPMWSAKSRGTKLISITKRGSLTLPKTLADVKTLLWQMETIYAFHFQTLKLDKTKIVKKQIGGIKITKKQYKLYMILQNF